MVQGLVMPIRQQRNSHEIPLQKSGAVDEAVVEVVD